MKKSLLILYVFISFNIFAQEITYLQDEMTDEYIFFFKDSQEKSGLLISKDGNEGIVIRITFKEDLSINLPSKLTPSTILADFIMEGVNCVEGGFLIIKFENGSKIQMNNWKSFNCESEFYFTPTKFQFNELYLKRIDKIMIQDGRSYKSYTHIPDNPDYFIELAKALKKFETIK